MQSRSGIPESLDAAGRTYTKRRQTALQLQFVLQLALIVAYALWGLPGQMGHNAERIGSNFYLQVALCWAPLWVLCLASSIPTAFHSFFLDRKHGISASSLSVRLIETLKANSIAFVISGLIIEIAFFSNRFF